MRRIVLQLFVFVSAFVALVASAQVPLASDLRLMTQGDVHAILQQADGKVIVGGDFTRVAGVPRRNLARLNSDGTLDLTWDPSPDGVVRAIALDGSQVIVGGQFAHAGGATRANLAKLDGSSGAATSFALDTDGVVLSLLVDAGVLYVGGDFTTLGGQPRTRLASVDLSTSNVVSGFAPAPNGAVRALVVRNSTLYVGGSFTSISSSSRSRLAAVDKGSGVLVSWSASANGDVYALATDGVNIFIGGEFTSINGTTRNHVAAVDSSPSAALSGWDPNANGNVYALRIDANTVYLGGLYASMGAQPRANLAAVDRSTAALLSWNPGAGTTVRALARGTTRTYVGGPFDTAAGVRRVSFAAINDSGANIAGWAHVGNAGVVNTLVPQADGRVLAGGNFLVAHDAAGAAQPRGYLLRLNADGTLDATWAPETNYIVQAMATDGTSVFVGGAFTRAGGATRQRIAAFDANSGALSTWNPGANGNVLALMADGNGTIYAGGEFSTAGGQSRSRLAAFDTAGATLPWNPGANGAVTSLANLDGVVVVGGYFSVVAGGGRNFLAAITGVTASNAGTLMPFDPQPNGAVLSLFVEDGVDVVYAGGPFSTIGGAARNALAAIDFFTSQATAWNPVAGNVQSIVKRSSLVYAGGAFSTLGGQSRTNLGVVDATTGLADAWNPPADGDVRAIAVRNALVFAGGTFTHVAGVARDGLVILPAAGASTSRLGVIVNGSGSVAGANGGIACGTDCQEDIADGSLVTLTATAASGSTFVGWSGPCSGTGTCSFLMNGSVNVGAQFADHFTVSANVLTTGGGQGRVVSNPAGIDCGPDCFEDYAYNTVVTFTAVPEGPSYFTGWSSSSNCSGTGTCTLTIDANKTAVATFARGAQLTAGVTGPGKITSNPAGIDCGATCTKVFAFGTAVTFTAVPDAGKVFAGWTGSCSGTAPTCTLTLNADSTIGASFANGPTLTVNITGNGSVASSPSGIACPSDCSEEYTSGTPVTLTATPGIGQRFTGWSGDCSGTGTCTVTMGTSRSVTATFVPGRILTVTKVGDGAGRVRSNPAGINCGNDCTEDYSGQGPLVTVTLTAEPDPVSYLLFWSSPCSFDSLTCTVDMPEALNSREIVVGFAANRVQVILNGPGTVTGNGINCGSDCEEVVPRGSAITLTATPAPGAVFLGWSDYCTGTGPCTITVDRGANIGAIFGTGDLGVYVESGGRVVSNPAGIDCGVQCNFVFAYGSQVTLQAIADAGMRFDHWDGDCQGQGATCTLTLQGESFAIAVFVRKIAVGDLNGDGTGDLVFQNADGRIAAWTMNGLSPINTANLIGAGAGWSVTHTADLNGDGKADILLKHTDGRVYAYLMDGVNVTLGRELLGAGLGWSVSHTADLNGDGKADLILRNADGRAYVWLMDGVNVIGSASLLPAASGWNVVGTGDFNADGKADIVFMHDDGRGYLYLMDGTTITGGTGFLSAGSGWTVSHVGDFDGDGKSDLVFRHTDGRAFLYLMNGTTFGPGASILDAGTGWSVTHVGDLDGDGKADLVFRHTDGRAHLRLMNGTATVAGKDALPAASGWRVTQMLDVNGDGKLDLVFRHDDGRITVRLMNGIASTANANLIPAGGWSVVPPAP